MPKCVINNEPIEVQQGTTIISAFKKFNKDIAHYCWHPGLSVAGVCRLCMVEIEGVPKLQIACNTEVEEGMRISNQSEKVKSAVKWGLEFHLINHPLDCPICDQAGECELQEQYMNFGRYRPAMAERKVKKRKVIDLGSKIVLDSERCILCTRCVRFTDEVSKTHELGIFDRGDRSEIGIFKDKPLENNYAINTVDICPVGALTAKDFRFKQRVWYLKTVDSICTGCSTGCNVHLDYNEEGVFRVRPRYNEKINGYWMCDKGREIYKLVNPVTRLKKACVPKDNCATGDNLGTSKNPTISSKSSFSSLGTVKVLQAVNDLLKKADKTRVAVVLTAQYTVEEYDDFITFFKETLLGKDQMYYWQNNLKSFDDFDGLLFRGDWNPNTKGLLEVLEKHSVMISPWENLVKQLEDQNLDMLFVAGPENQKAYPSLTEKIKLFGQCKNVVWWTAHPLSAEEAQFFWQIPTRTFFEKTGHFVNFSGQVQKIKEVHSLVPSAVSLSDSVSIFKGEFSVSSQPLFSKDFLKTNYFAHNKESL